MDDIRLLELAGLAAGQTFDADNNPLERDDLALRLAVKLGLHVDVQKMAGCSIVFLGGTFFDDQLEWHDPDAGAATRRAIVRAAAKLASSDNLPNIA